MRLESLKKDKFQVINNKIKCKVCKKTFKNPSDADILLSMIGEPVLSKGLVFKEFFGLACENCYKKANSIFENIFCKK